MRSVDKYWLILIASILISAVISITSYFSTLRTAADSLFESTVENVNNYLEVTAASMDTKKKKEEIKKILEKTPYVKKVIFGKSNGKGKFVVHRTLYFPDGMVDAYVVLDEENIISGARKTARSVAFVVFITTVIFQSLILWLIRSFYLKPLGRIRRDIKKIQSGKLEKIPEEGSDEFGRIRKNINIMIESIKERDIKAEIISQFIQLLTIGKGFNGEFVELMRKALETTNTDGVIIGIPANEEEIEIRLITKKDARVLKKKLSELEGIEPYILEMGREVETSKETLLSPGEKELGIKNLFGIPIQVFSSNIGYCIFYRTTSEPFKEENKNFIRNIVKSIAISVQLRKLIRELEEKLSREKKLTDSIIRSLVRGIEIRDSYTRGHSERVAFFAKRIAEELGMSKEKTKAIYMAALLHDVGKIGIPDSILLKPGRLGDKEYEIIKLHPILSFELLKHIEFFKEFLPGIKYHHERWDGSGYPEGLKGEEIPLQARIIAIADSFDAMTSDRIYRKSRTKKEAAKEIKRLAGKSYDPELVTIALPILLHEEPEEFVEEYLDPKLLKDLEERRLDYFLKDFLTGAFNRTALELAYSLAKERAGEVNAYSVDITKLREINIKEGWKRGDEILRKLTDLIEKEINPLSIVRYSGDNFIFFTGKDVDAKTVLKKISKIESALGVDVRLTPLRNVEDVEKLKIELTELEFSSPE